MRWFYAFRIQPQKRTKWFSSASCASQKACSLFPLFLVFAALATLNFVIFFVVSANVATVRGPRPCHGVRFGPGNGELDTDRGQRAIEVAKTGMRVKTGPTRAWLLLVCDEEVYRGGRFLLHFSTLMRVFCFGISILTSIRFLIWKFWSHRDK